MSFPYSHQFFSASNLEGSSLFKIKISRLNQHVAR